MTRLLATGMLLVGSVFSGRAWANIPVTNPPVTNMPVITVPITTAPIANTPTTDGATDGDSGVGATDTADTANDIETEVEIDVIEFADDDIPEEILRTEIITAARSPLTGEPLSAAEYAQLLETLEAPAGGTLVSQDIQYLFFLLELRRRLKPILPFIK